LFLLLEEKVNRTSFESFIKLLQLAGCQFLKEVHCCTFLFSERKKNYFYLFGSFSSYSLGTAELYKNGVYIPWESICRSVLFFVSPSSSSFHAVGADAGGDKVAAVFRRACNASVTMRNASVTFWVASVTFWVASMTFWVASVTIWRAAVTFRRRIATTDCYRRHFCWCLIFLADKNNNKIILFILLSQYCQVKNNVHN